MATRENTWSLAENSNLKGIAWMVVTGFFFVGVTGIVRHLGSDMNPIQGAFIRYLIGALMMLPLLLRVGRHELKSARYGLHISRGLVHGIAVMLWFFAMARIPIAEVTALGYIAPIFTTIGAALFFGETMHLRRIGAVVIGFVGMLVILRPGLHVINIGAWAQLAAAPLFAVSFLISKRLTEREGTTAIVAALSVFVTLTLLPGAIMVWRTPTMDELFWLTMTAACATAGHFTLTQAFRAAEITALQPVQFLQLVWATILGLVVFGEQPDLWTWVGAAIIVGSATYIAHREAVATGRARAKAVAQ